MTAFAVIAFAFALAVLGGALIAAFEPEGE